MNRFLLMFLFSGCCVLLSAQSHSFRQLRMEHGLSNATILDLCQDTNGFIWIATEDGLNRFDGERVVEYNVGLPNFSLPGSGVRLVESRPNGTLMIKLREWEGSNDLRQLSRDGAWTLAESGSDSLASPLKRLIDSKGAVWMATQNQGILYQPANQTDAIRMLSNPHDPGSLINNQINVIFEDRQQNIWLGGEHTGLCWTSLNQDPFSAWYCIPGNTEALMGNDITALARDDQGIWLAVKGKGLSRYDNESGLFENHPFYESWPEITAMHPDGSGGIYLATRGAGILYYDIGNRKLTVLYQGEEGNDNSSIIRHLLHDGRGSLWFCSHDGLIRIDMKTRMPVLKGLEEANNPAFPDFLIMFCIAADPHGNLWVGSEGGLIKLSWDGSHAKLLGMYNGDSGMIRKGYPIFSIHFDRMGKLWTGTFGGGISCADTLSGELSVFDRRNGLSNNTVYQILEDFKADIWASTNNGINRIDSENHTVDAFFSRDGLLCSSFYPRSGIELNDSVLIFGGDHGACIIYTQRFNKAANTNPVCFTQATLSGGKKDSMVHFPKSLKIKYPVTALTAEFSQPHFEPTHKPRLLYRLLPYDTVWKECGIHRNLFFTSLRPGLHQLQIRAVSPHLNYGSGQPLRQAELKIKVIPRIYQRPSVWFATVFLILWIILLFFFQQIRQKNRILGLRNQIAADLHDEVASGIGAIKFLVEQERDQEFPKDGLLKRIGELAGETGRVMRDIVWLVNPHHDHPGQIIAKMRESVNTFKHGLDVQFCLRDENKFTKSHLPALQQYYLILREAMNNVVRHSGATIVIVCLECRSGRVYLSIEDNGGGLTFNDYTESDLSSVHQHEPTRHGMGIRNMQKRARQAGSYLKLSALPEGGLKLEVIPLTGKE